MAKLKRYLIKSETVISAVNDKEAEKIQKSIWKHIKRATDIRASPKRAIRYSNIKYKRLKELV